MIARVKATRNSDAPANLHVNWSDIATAQQNNPEVQHLCKKAYSQTIKDPSRVHYVMQNGFLLHSVPDGEKGPKLLLVIPASL